jgi:tetratricopeptide (TPR) repeat protein
MQGDVSLRAQLCVVLWLLAMSTIPGCQACGVESGNIATVARIDAAERTYAGALLAVDRQLDDARDLVKQRGGWSDYELVAQLHVRRARLTGSIEDWVAADQALDAGFEVAPAGGGPVLTRLELDLSLHRLAEAQAGIKRVEAAPLRTAATEIQLATARGELAAQRGELDRAERAYVAASHMGAEPAMTAIRVALLDRRRGNYDAALRGLANAKADTAGGQPSAWLSLQMGLTEWARDQPEAALANYDAAEQAFPGWWLVTEHRAEALAALGRIDEAQSLYRGVIEQTGHPEFMDALAEILASQGHEAEAQALIARARREHERRIVALPTGAGAHALDHLIAFAPDDPRTLELASQVARSAPNEDNLRRLAELLLVLGKVEAAREALTQARAGGASNPQLDALSQRAGLAGSEVSPTRTTQ